MIFSLKKDLCFRCNTLITVLTLMSLLVDLVYVICIERIRLT